MHGQFQAAISNGYLVDVNNPFLSSAYYNWCDSRNLPFVRINKETGYAHVELDMITVTQGGTPRHLSGPAVRMIRKILEKEHKEGFICWGAVYSSSHGIPAERVESVATSIYVVAMDDLDNQFLGESAIESGEPESMAEIIYLNEFRSTSGSAS